MGEDFPNCVAGRWDTSVFAVGHLSHNRISSLFITVEELQPDRATWSERADGHYCGFSIPPYLYADRPRGFGIHATSQTLGWDCPYWMMALFWFTIFLKTRGRFQFQLRDLFLAMTVLAVALSLIQLKLVLIGTAILNLATLRMLLYLAIGSLTALFSVETKEVSAERRSLSSPTKSAEEP